MNDPTRQPISDAAEMETRSELDARLIQESAGKGDTTIHGVPPFTMPMADGTLRASSNIGWSETGNITGMRKRQGEIARSDQDGDGNHTNLNGYRDPGSDRRTDGNDGRSQRKTGALSSGSVTRKSFLQRVRKGFFPILLGIAVGWYYDAIEVLIFRRDPRIKGNLLTFSLLCWLVMLSIFFYLEFLRPLILKKPTNYVTWEVEFRHPIQVATVCLIMGVIGSNIALWPVWHLSTFLVLGSLAVAAIKFLGIFF